MKIIVDADACPVKEIIIKVGKELDIPIMLVHSLSHVSHHSHDVEQIIVDNVSQAADMMIMNKAKKGDLLITQDYGLASIALGKGALVLHHGGMRYTDENINQLLFQRHLSAKIRRAGGKTKGPKAFTNEDRERFEHSLRNVLKNR
jgi:uncharacterized protein YaiI (UPF0178 family)